MCVCVCIAKHNCLLLICRVIISKQRVSGSSCTLYCWKIDIKLLVNYQNFLHQMCTQYFYCYVYNVFLVSCNYSDSIYIATLLLFTCVS